MLVCVALTRGRVSGSSLQRATSMEQPHVIAPLSEVTIHLRAVKQMTKSTKTATVPTLKSGVKWGKDFLHNGKQGVGTRILYDDVLCIKIARDPRCASN